MYIYIYIYTLCFTGLSIFHVRTTGNVLQVTTFRILKKSHAKDGCFYAFLFLRFRLVAGSLRLGSHESRCI